MEKLRNLCKLHKGLCYWESKILEEIMSDHANRKNPSCLITDNFRYWYNAHYGPHCFLRVYFKSLAITWYFYLFLVGSHFCLPYFWLSAFVGHKSVTIGIGLRSDLEKFFILNLVFANLYFKTKALLLSQAQPEQNGSSVQWTRPFIYL